MNRKLHSHALAACLALAVPLLPACSSTPTQESAGQFIDSSVLTAKVKSALAEDPMTDALEIGVETYKGNVQLSGFVDDTRQKLRAEQVARRVDGVVGVNNGLIVQPRSQSVGEYVDDTTLTARVKARIAEDPRLNPFVIGVETQRGVVQLSGFVDDRGTRTLATRVASNTPGVKGVRNSLALKPAS